MPVTFIDVTEDYSGQRLDNFLMARLKGVPRSKIYNIIRKGEVRVNKGRAKPTYKLIAGDRVRVPPVQMAESREVQVSDSLFKLLQRSIVYEDRDWLVINKPNDLAVHGGSGLSLGLIEAMRKIRPEDKFLELCHRIDKATSGCVVLARRRASLKLFHRCLREKALQKNYLAVVVGRWPRSTNAVKLALQKNVLASGERIVRTDPEGKRSVTLFEVEEPLQGYTLVQASPVTGRTHQIRVHCQAMGHAIVGDDKYGNREMNKKAAELGFRHLFLHAHCIELPVIDDSKSSSMIAKSKMIEAPPPEFWQTFIDANPLKE